MDDRRALSGDRRKKAGIPRAPFKDSNGPVEGSLDSIQSNNNKTGYLACYSLLTGARLIYNDVVDLT